MPRAKKLRPELEEHGVMTNEYGIEIGRLTLNGILVLNTAEVYMEIERWSAAHRGECTINHLNRVFSRTGSWGFDPGVEGAIYELLHLGVIRIENEENIVTTMSAHTALKRIPAYVTRAEAHASLEPIDE